MVIWYSRPLPCASKRQEERWGRWTGGTSALRCKLRTTWVFLGRLMSYKSTWRCHFILELGGWNLSPKRDSYIVSTWVGDWVLTEWHLCLFLCSPPTLGWAWPRELIRPRRTQHMWYKHRLDELLLWVCLVAMLP